MSALAIALVLISCVLHAGWNLLVKRARDTTAFTALALMSGVLIYLPLFVFFARAAKIPPTGWLCVLGTGLAYWGYYRGVAQAYAHGELSTVYPLMRGIGPVCAFVGGIVLLGERPTLLGAAGVGLIVTGIFALFGGVRRENWNGPATRAALFVGLMYGAYSLVDKAAVGRFRLPPFLYLYLTYAVGAFLFVPWFLRTRGPDALRAEWRANGPGALAVGVLDMLTYLLVLTALSLPDAPVSYIVPLRTLSVLLGVALGVRTLGEGRPRVKFFAAIVMIAGLALMTWKG